MIRAAPIALLSATLLGACESSPRISDGGDDTTGNPSATGPSSSGSADGGDGGSADDGADGATAGDDADTGADGADDGGAFIEPPDGGWPCGECDPHADAACPDDEKCTYYSLDGYSYPDCIGCFPIGGDRQPGESCTYAGMVYDGQDDCVAGTMCAWLDESGTGICLPFCAGTSECVPGQYCMFGGQSGPYLCTFECDPLQNDCPAGASYCADMGGTTFACEPPYEGATGTHGSPCEYASACESGTTCVAAQHFPSQCTSESCCSSLCNLEGPNTCPEAAQGQQCLPYYNVGTAPEQFAHIGFCGVI